MKNTMNQRNAKNKNQPKQGSGAKKALIVVIIIALIIIIGAGLAIAYFLGWFGKKEAPLSVELDNKTYTEDTKNLYFENGLKFKVNSQTRSCDVRIEVNEASDRNFSFVVGGETGYRWRYLGGMDATQAFHIEKDENEYTLSYGSLADVLKSLEGDDALISADEVTGRNLFVLIVSNEESEIRLSFHIDEGDKYYKVTFQTEAGENVTTFRVKNNTALGDIPDDLLPKYKYIKEEYFKGHLIERCPKEFLGWYEGDTKITSETVVESNITAVGKFSLGNHDRDLLDHGKDNEGHKVYEQLCAYCGYTTGDYPIHIMTLVSDHSEGTCGSGYYLYKCKLCNYEKKEISNHNYTLIADKLQDSYGHQFVELRCESCREMQTVTYHTYQNGVCTKCGRFQPSVSENLPYGIDDLYNGGSGDNKGDNEGKDPDPNEPHEHDFTGAWVQGAAEHYHQCTGCSETRDNAAHEYQDGACTVCGKPDPSEHEHDFTGAWVQGADEHYHKCTGCNEIQDNAVHEYQDGACTVCGKTLHEHDFTGAWVQDENEHYHQCTGCNETQDNAAHDYQDGACTVCGKPDPDAHEHDFTGAWVQDVTTHYHKCTGCEAKQSIGTHSYQDVTCIICGKTHEHKYSTFSWDSDSLNHYRVCGVAGCNAQKDSAAHSYSHGICTVCKRPDPSYQCSHSYGDWQTTNTQHYKECINCGGWNLLGYHEFMDSGICEICGYDAAESCGCLCNGCECAYGFTCINDADYCKCACHGRIGKDEEEFLESSYFFGEELGYNTDSGEFKVAFTFEYPQLRDYFDVSVNFDQQNSRVYFNITPKDSSQIGLLSYFTVTACKGGNVYDIQGSVEEGSFEIRGSNYSYCMEYDDHYYIVYVYCRVDVADYVVVEGDADDDFELVAEFIGFSKEGGVNVFVHTNFEYVITNWNGQGFDPDNPFGGFYYIAPNDGILSIFLEREENVDMEELGFAGYEEIDCDDERVKVLKYNVSNGSTKIDVCCRGYSIKVYGDDAAYNGKWGRQGGYCLVANDDFDVRVVNPY